VARKPLTLEDREEISRGLAKGLGNKDIAVSLGRDESVVSREITRHGGREKYRAHRADAAARQSCSRPKERKIDTGDLRNGWSPGQIAGRLCYERSRGGDLHARPPVPAGPSAGTPLRGMDQKSVIRIMRDICGMISWHSGGQTPRGAGHGGSAARPRDAHGSRGQVPWLMFAGHVSGLPCLRPRAWRRG